jgi:hypothetical protein
VVVTDRILIVSMVPPQSRVKKKGVGFQAGPPYHPARPIGRGRSNQRESLASPDSPSHCASLATPLSPVGCACGEQRQSRRNRRWGKIGGEVGYRRHWAIIPHPYRQLNPVPGNREFFHIIYRNDDDGSPRRRVMLHLSG